MEKKVNFKSKKRNFRKGSLEIVKKDKIIEKYLHRKDIKK